MRSKLKAILRVFPLLAVTGCASIVSRSVYPVTIDTIPPGASIVVRDKVGKVLFKGTAPTTLTLKAYSGYFSPARYDVDATLPGYNPGKGQIRGTLDPWYVGNVLFGGLIGLLIVDPATGAMWRLDDHITVPLTKCQSGASRVRKRAPLANVEARRIYFGQPDKGSSFLATRYGQKSCPLGFRLTGSSQ